jgi:signal transduction histidine kinase
LACTSIAQPNRLDFFVPVETDERPFLLAELPPSQGQIRLAIILVAALVVAFGVTASFLNTPLQRIDAFIPTLEAICVVSDLVTSALLYAQFSISRRWALLALASGFLFTALITIPHALTFPGAFAPMGLLGANLQSTAWLYNFWKIGLPLAVILYALLKNANNKTVNSERSLRPAILGSIAITIALVCGLTLTATAGEAFLPRLMIDGTRGMQTNLLLVGSVTVLFSVAALLFLWVRRTSVLDLWLIVVCCAIVLEIAMNYLIMARFSIGWYASRIYSFTASIVVLLVLLSETTTLYANLALSVMRQRSAREGRQITMDAMAASIAHEIRQPIGAMVTDASASSRWLRNSPPNLDEALLALSRVVSNGHRAADVITSLRTMFKKDARGRVSFGMNELVQEVLTTLNVDLRTQRVSVTTQLSVDVPPLVGDRGQLQQVLLNLMMNAIEAMGSSQARMLRVSSNTIQQSSGVMVTIEDTGIGIEHEAKGRIFEPFFTTKAGGMGIGLAICRSIVEAHGGTLATFANKPHGTIFRVALPNGVYE